MDETESVNTLADLARIAGVSTSTVSRALADSPLVQEKTKQLIRQIAEQHNYRPHLGARNLRTKCTNVIALVLPFFYADESVFTNPYFLKVIGTVDAALRQHGFDLLLSQVTSISAEIDDRYLRPGVADGVIILGRGTNDPDKMAALVERQIPLVVIGPMHEAQSYCSVGIDNVEGGRLVVKHFAESGRKRIGIIYDYYSGYAAEAGMRYEGYLQGLAEIGHAIDPTLIARSTYSVNSAKQAARDLLDSAPDVDAIFVATSDVVAIGVMQALQEMGKRIPEDIAIVGFDNIDLCNHVIPPLSSVSQRLNDGVITKVVGKLLEQLAGQPVQSEMLSAKVVVRESSGGVT